MRTSKSSLLTALVAALSLALVGATGAQAAKSFDGYLDFDPAICRAGAKSERDIDMFGRSYKSGRYMHFGSMEPRIFSRPVGGAAAPTSQYVHVRWGMRHWDHMGPGKPYDEWRGWKLARVNRYGNYDPFFYLGYSSVAWWDVAAGRPSLEANGLDWTVEGSYYQKAWHTPMLDVYWYNANSTQSVHQAYLVPLLNGTQLNNGNTACYLNADGYGN